MLIYFEIIFFLFCIETLLAIPIRKKGMVFTGLLFAKLVLFEITPGGIQNKLHAFLVVFETRIIHFLF